jgi:hypothetical protein
MSEGCDGREPAHGRPIAVMYQHPTEQHLTQYKMRTLPPHAFLAVHSHVSECDRCAARCYEPQQNRADYEALLGALTPDADEPPYHLTDETAAAYAADTLHEIDREAAFVHLEVCEECAATVERLRALPASPAAQTTEPPVADEPRARTWAQLWPSRLLHLRPVPLVAVSLLFVALLAAALLLLRQRNSQPAKLVWQDAPPANDNSQATPGVTPAQTREGLPPEQNLPPVPSPSQRPTQAQVAPVVLKLNDGGQEIALDEHGNLAGLEQLPEQVRRLVKSALVAQQLARPAVLADLNPQGGTLRGGGDNVLPFRPLAPLGVVVESDRPTFRWQPLAGADTYNVTVTDERLNEVATSGPLTATAWRVPRPLARGTIYSWQVTARRRDGQTVTVPVMPAPQAKFQVLARARLEELQRVRRAYPGAHLSLGVLYAHAGLLDEAAREFRALARANPGSPVASKLLRGVELNARRRSE